MATERIENLISKEALDQFSKLKEINDANISSFEKLIAKTVELNKQLGGAKTFKQVVDGTKELEKAEADLAKKKSDLEKQQARLNALFTDEAKKIAELKVQQQEQNKALKEQAREALGLTDAYKKLENEYNKAAKEAKNLAAQFGAQSKEAQEASKRALELDKRLKEADANVGRFNRNVGNYSGAMKILEKALDDVRKKMDDYTNSGQQNDDVLQALVKEQSLLESLLQNQATGFSTVNAELKEGQKALQQLKAAGLENSEAFQKLFVEVAKGRDQLASFKKELLARGSGEIFLNGAINAAQTLAGIYGIAQGATALFGDENEELQKTMVKLQAVVAVLNGLEALNNVLKKESALRTALNVGLQKAATIQTNLQTAAESRNIVVKYAAIAAQKALNLAMAAAGGPILMVIGLIALMLLSLKSFASQAEASAKSLGQLTAEFERDSKAVDSYINDVKRLGDEQLADLQRNFASEKEIRDQRSKSLREQFRATFDLERQYAADIERQRYKLVKILKKSQEDMTEDEKKQVEDQDKLIRDYQALQQKRMDLASQIRIGSAENERATREESIKAQQDDLEGLKTYLQTRANTQNEIVGNDKKSYDERIAALDEFRKLQTRILQADTQKQLLVPTLTPSQRRLIVAQAKSAQEEINRNAARQRQAFIEEQASRERKAQFDIARASIETEAAAAQEIASNQDKAFEDRLHAAYEYFKAQEALILGQKNLELSNATLTATERQAIEEQANANIIAARIAFNNQVRDLTLQNLDIESQRRINIQNKERDEALTALNEQYNAGKISLEQYEQEKLKIERKYTKESLQLQIDNVKKVIAEYKNQGKDVAAEEAKLADLEKRLSDEVTDYKIANAKRLKELQEQFAYETFDTLTSLVNFDFDNQKAKLEAQTEALEKKAAADRALIEASAATQIEKEEQLAQVEARAQSQREALDRRQRQIDIARARFEKTANIAKIIADTAAAIANQLKVTPLPFGAPFIAAIGAIGALQLTRAIAAPIPKFATGTNDAPGGLAVVGDAYRSELMVTPDGELVKTPAVPTVMNVPKHSIILPDADQALRAMSSHLAMNHTAPALVDHGRYYREMTTEIGGKLDKLNRTIKNKREIHIHRSRDGWHTMTKSGGNTNNYLNNNLQF